MIVSQPLHVAIVGAQGFIGSHLVNACKNSGMRVMTLSSKGTPCYLDMTTGKLLNVDLSKDLFCVVYLSQSPFHRHGMESFSHLMQINTINAIQLAQLAKSSHVKRFIYCSTGNVYRPSYSPSHETHPLEPDSPYAYSKICAELGLKMFRDNQFQVIVLRPFGVFGRGQQTALIPNLIHRVKHKLPITLAPGETEGGLKLSLSPINDTVEILLNVIQHGCPDVMNLASPFSASIFEITQFISSVCGIEAVYTEAPIRRRGNLLADTTTLTQNFAKVWRPWTEEIKKMIQTDFSEENSK